MDSYVDLRYQSLKMEALYVDLQQTCHLRKGAFV
jgi:hypothetical protein